jgi:dienelactone hydrolase
MVRVLFALALAGCASAVPRADLTDGPTGTQFIQGATTVPATVISGELTLPGGAAGRGPAVALIHGSHGVGGNMPFCRSELTGIGVATFVVDSFTGRGVQETATDQSRVATAAMVVDAYHALALLATQPAIDPERIAVMGFSKGGTVSAASSLERFHRLWGPAVLR